MEPKGFHRKLTAILSADVAGYSRLMQDDEAATVKTLEAYKQIISDLVKQHRGRVVDSPGDNLLAEFASVVDAVQCAVAIQKELQARNAELPENRKMQFRIGVNLGDVIEEDSRIYGDGVNIAARLETLSDPGGICVSKSAFDHIESKLPLGYEYLGEQQVKNITKPIGAYRVLMEPRVTIAGQPEKKRASRLRRIPILAGIAAVLVLAIAAGIWQFYSKQQKFDAASVEKMTHPLPDKPSIAVLPFTNMSGDPKQEYFSDAFTENVITALSKIHNLFVIARNTSFFFKGKNFRINQLAEELGVRYVLEGSIQKTESRVRITAQLIDAIKGSHLWADRYDADVKDVLMLQDEIAKKIITSLHIKLTYGEDARISAKYTNSLEAYLKWIEGHHHQMRLNKEDNILARQLFMEATALDLNYVSAYTELAWTHLFDASYGWTASRADSLEKANEYAKKALSLDPSFAGAYAALGSVHMNKGEFEAAIGLREKAISLEPNSANYHALLGISLLFAGYRTEEAIQELKIANRLDPFPPNWILHYLGDGYRVKGEYKQAIDLFEKAIKNDSDYWLSYLSLSACYGLLGKQEEAKAAATEALRVNPNLSVAKMMIPFRHNDDKERTLSVLHKAGLK